MSSTRSEINIVISQNFERSSTTEIIRGTNSSTFSFTRSWDRNLSTNQQSVANRFLCRRIPKGNEKETRASTSFFILCFCSRNHSFHHSAISLSYEISRIGFLAPLDASTALKGARSLNCLLKSVIELISSLGN